MHVTLLLLDLGFSLNSSELRFGLLKVSCWCKSENKPDSAQIWLLAPPTSRSYFYSSKLFNWVRPRFACGRCCGGRTCCRRHWPRRGNGKRERKLRNITATTSAAAALLILSRAAREDMRTSEGASDNQATTVDQKTTSIITQSGGCDPKVWSSESECRAASFTATNSRAGLRSWVTLAPPNSIGWSCCWLHNHQSNYFCSHNSCVSWWVPIFTGSSLSIQSRHEEPLLGGSRRSLWKFARSNRDWKRRNE